LYTNHGFVLDVYIRFPSTSPAFYLPDFTVLPTFWAALFLCWLIEYMMTLLKRLIKVSLNILVVYAQVGHALWHQRVCKLWVVQINELHSAEFGTLDVASE
jgi:hypothetical protein